MTNRLLEAAMAVPPNERAELAERLWESLPSDIADVEFAEDLTREVRSRRERHLKNGSSFHNWNDVREELEGIISRFDQA